MISISVTCFIFMLQYVESTFNYFFHKSLSAVCIPESSSLLLMPYERQNKARVLSYCLSPKAASFIVPTHCNKNPFCTSTEIWFKRLPRGCTVYEQPCLLLSPRHHANSAPVRSKWHTQWRAFGIPHTHLPFINLPLCLQ